MVGISWFRLSLEDGDAFHGGGARFREGGDDCAPVGALVADDDGGASAHDVVPADENAVLVYAEKVGYDAAGRLRGQIERQVAVMVLGDVLGKGIGYFW